MPATRLNKNTSTPIEQYWVCAKESHPQNFVIHVGLSSEMQNANYGDEISWTHMAPPFQQNGICEVNIIAWIDLSDEDRDTITDFVALYKEEIEKVRWKTQYIIFPCQSPASPDRSYRQFSCVGFVLEVYKMIGLTLLDETFVPERTLEYLCKYYQVPNMRNPEYRAKFGLHGDGPWPVVLPGYVLNSFNRSDKEIREKPFRPGESDAYFRS